MSEKRKINSDEFLAGIKSAFLPLKEALNTVDKKIKKVNDNLKNELRTITDKIKQSRDR